MVEPEEAGESLAAKGSVLIFEARSKDVRWRAFEGSQRACFAGLRDLRYFVRTCLLDFGYGSGKMVVYSTADWPFV